VRLQPLALKRFYRGAEEARTRRTSDFRRSLGEPPEDFFVSTFFFRVFLCHQSLFFFVIGDRTTLLLELYEACFFLSRCSVEYSVGCGGVYDRPSLFSGNSSWWGASHFPTPPFNPTLSFSLSLPDLNIPQGSFTVRTKGRFRVIGTFFPLPLGCSPNSHMAILARR